MERAISNSYRVHNNSYVKYNLNCVIIQQAIIIIITIGINFSFSVLTFTNYCSPDVHLLFFFLQVYLINGIK